MAEGILLGAALGGGSAMLTGNDPLKGAALGGAMGGASAGFGSAGVASGAGATMPAHLAQTGAQQAASNAAAGSMFGGVGDTIGQGFDYINDMTGMENKDWTQMGLSQGINAMQPEQQQQIQAAPMGQGISRPQVDLSQSRGSLLSSNPMTSGAGGQQLTPEQLQKLKQQGLL
jgi:hypothetical protein